MAVNNSPQSDNNSVSSEIEPGSAARLINKLRNAIESGMYSMHERLPAERSLAEQFSTSRGTVREALKHLEELGLVARKVGSGTFVSFQGESVENEIARATSPLELIEVRLGIESQIVRLAVLNANGHDLDKLNTALRRVENTHNDPRAFGEADSAFHLALADCTQNPLMRWLYRQLNEIRKHNQWSIVKDKVLNRDRIDHYNAQHRALFEAIKARDMEGAQVAISEHLEKARSHLLGARAQ